MKALTDWALANQKLIFLVTALILIVGPISFQSHPSREDPAITIRTAVVTAVAPGMAPRRVEDLITRKLEEEIRQMTEVENIRSTSRAGSATLRVELYDSYSELEPVWQDLRNRMNDVRSELPSGTYGPFVNDDYGAVAMATIAVTGSGFSMAEVAVTARELRRQLYTVKGLSKVELYGVEQDTIFVEFDTARLAQLGLSAQMLVSAVQQTNVVASGGRLQADGVTLTVEPTGNFESVEDIRNVAIEVPNLDGQLVYLKDLAEVRREYADPPEHPILVNGVPAIVLGIQMVEQFDANAFGIALNQRVVELEHALPIGYQLQFVTFQPTEVDKAIGNVMSNLYQTIAIVLLVVMAFLGWRTGLIVGVMVPLTMLMTLLIMRLTGIELERMSLATLIIALGLLVDNGIVVSEEIGRRLALGQERLAAARVAGRSLAVPLLASSLTTVVAFLPLMLADNEAGEYTRSLSIVIAIALLGSWVLAMMVTPLACVVSMKVTTPVDAAEQFATPLYQRYKRTLEAALHYRWIFLTGTAGLLVAALWAMQFVPKSFFPASDRAQFQVYVDLPVGSNTYSTSAVTQRLSTWLADDDHNPEVASHVAYIAHGGPRFYLGLNPIDPDPHRAFVIVNTASFEQVPEVISRIRSYANDHLPEARVTVKPMSMGATEAGLVEYRVVGADANQLEQITRTIKSELRAIDGSINIRDDWENRIVKIVPNIQQAEARRAGVTTESVARALNATLSGYAVTEYRDGDQLVPVYFRASADERTNIDRLRTLNVGMTDGAPTPLFQVARLEGAAEFSMIQRRNLERVVTVSAKHVSLSAAAYDALVQERLQDLALPPGYRIEVGGEIENSSEAQGALFANMPLAALLIVAILVGQFNSFSRPLLILGVIPLSLIGVTVALLLMPGAQLSFMAILGILSLAGIIINNAIVLIDKIDLERARGIPQREAIVTASMARLRPIVMTTITTILGLMPLIWSRDVLFYDLAIVISGGLVIGTLLTLGVVPILYSLVVRDRPEVETGLVEPELDIVADST